MKKSGSCPGPDILRARLFFREVTSSLNFIASTPEGKTEKSLCEDLCSWCGCQGTNSRSTKRVTTMVELDVGDHRMIKAPETEIAQFTVVVLEGSVAVTTVAVADHMMIDLLDHGIHGRRTCHSPAFAANRRLPLIGDCLPGGPFGRPSLYRRRGSNPHVLADTGF
jgi:hypothetical protein